jgi:RNA recognition motif-containing protein
MSYLSWFILIAVAVIVLLAIVVITVRIKRNRAGKPMQQHYPENEQLYVGNLSYQVNSQGLKEFFAQYGAVHSVRLIKNPKTGRSKGFAFVTFSSVKDAKKALESNGKDLRGRALVVRMAKPRDDYAD